MPVGRQTMAMTPRGQNIKLSPNSMTGGYAEPGQAVSICSASCSTALVLLALAVSGCASTPSALDPRGPVAREISDVAWVLFGIAFVVFLIVLSVLLHGAFRRRDSADGIDRRPVGTRTFAIGGVGVALTTIILVGLVLVDLRTSNAIAQAPTKSVLAVTVIGHEWWWEFQYRNYGFVTANEMHMPAGKPVDVSGTSVDVIHSFWVPQLQGKADLIPGHTNSLWLQADNPGEFRGQCAEYCGDQHAHMAFYVVADPQDRYNAWLDGQRRPALQPSDPVARHGMETFPGSACAGCHTIRGTAAQGKVGPDLTHVGSRGWIAAGTLTTTRDNLVRWISDPQGVKPGNRMPDLGLDPGGDFVQAASAYLFELK